MSALAELRSLGFRVYQSYPASSHFWLSHNFPSGDLELTFQMMARHDVSGRTVFGYSHAELLAKVEGTESGVPSPMSTEGCETTAVSPMPVDGDLWAWLGEEHRSKDWICKLVAKAEDKSQDWRERNEAFERLASYREREAERVNTAPFHFDGELYAPTPGRLIFDKDEEGLRKAKKRGKQKDTRGAVKVTREGETDWGLLGNDEAAIRGFMEKRAIDLGYNSLDHLAERKRGQQRLHLAMVVRDALGAGAKQSAVGWVIGRSKAVVSELAGLEA